MNTKIEPKSGPVAFSGPGRFLRSLRQTTSRFRTALRCPGLMGRAGRVALLSLAVCFPGEQTAVAAPPDLPLVDLIYPKPADPQNPVIQGYGLNGKLYVPPSHDQPGNTDYYPLVVAFHGRDDWYNYDTGANGLKPADIFEDLLRRADQDGFMVYMPQIIASPSSPSNASGVPTVKSGTTSWNYTNLDTALRTVSRATQEYRIDPDRIYFTGISMGGAGLWRAMHRFSAVTAASVSVCSSNNGKQFYEPLVDIPIMAFHAFNDTTVSHTKTELHINAVRVADGLDPWSFPSSNDGLTNPIYQQGNIIYHRFDAGGHSIWDTVYQRNDVYEWLFSHTNDRMGELEVGESIYFDLGSKSTPVVIGGSNYDYGSATKDENGDIWNASNLSSVANLEDCLIPFAQTTEGKVTRVSLDITGKFQSVFARSGTTGALYGPYIGTDGLLAIKNASETVNTGKIRIRGLEPGATYQVEIYGFEENDDNGKGRKTQYKIGSETRNLECAFNLTNTALFEAVEADSAGSFEVLVYKQPNTTSERPVINTIQVTRIDPALFYQDFEASDEVEDYLVEPEEDLEVGQFDDIDSEVEGGVWSILESNVPGVPGGVSRRLALTRPEGSTAGINGAGFTRKALGSSNEPEVVAVGFDVMINLTQSGGFNSILATLDVGNISSVTDYSSATANGQTAARLNLRSAASGTTSRLRFSSDTDAGETVMSPTFDGGAEVRALWLVNAGSTSYQYARPDDPEQTRVLAGGSGDLWITSGTAGPVLMNSGNLVRSSSFTSSTAGGLRFRGRTPKGVVITLDNITVIPLR